MIKTATKRGVRIECAVCRSTKTPRGRDGGMDNGRCDRDCAGYDAEPHVGSLWPGETDAEFGYPCSDVGTVQLSAYEVRGYHLLGEPGYTECRGGPDLCGGCDRCLRMQDEHRQQGDTLTDVDSPEFWK